MTWKAATPDVNLSEAASRVSGVLHPGLGLLRVGLLLITGAACAGPVADKPSHWAFHPPRRPPVPQVADPAGFLRNPIDAFILTALQRHGLAPSPEAEPHVLSRRLHLDLIGLLPEFQPGSRPLSGGSESDYLTQVDRLLRSPHHGERWARHWLDIARYADSNGFGIDSPRPMWKYRDWVINAFNRNLPFDRFVIEQIAGDLLPDATEAQRIATAFHRNTPLNEEGGIDPEEFRLKAVADRVNTTGIAFLGLTLGCAECHDHKFDPISQREYFRLFAFLNPARESVLELPRPEQLPSLRAWSNQVARAELQLREHEWILRSKQGFWESAVKLRKDPDLPAQLREALDHAPSERSTHESDSIWQAYRKADGTWNRLNGRLQGVRSSRPRIDETWTFSGDAPGRTTRIHVKGDPSRPGDKVRPGVPAILHPLDQSESNRLDFARWLASSRNPLLARVTVNRVWQRYFGRGIVATENDFGLRGDPPSHPDLLDWLAVEFMESGWNLRHLHRLIVTSGTYRQSSDFREDLNRADPGNVYLARQKRLRLDAEILRDTALCASGLLHPEIGGPGIYPPQPKGIMELGQMKRLWTPDPAPYRFRRGMYTYFWRATPHPALMVFDAPDSLSACTRRNRSNTPLQALTLLNDPGFVDYAQGLAARAITDLPETASDADRLRYLFLRCLSREPGPDELRRLLVFLEKQRLTWRKEPAAARESFSKHAPRTGRPVEQAAWMQVGRVLLNLDEMITRE